MTERSIDLTESLSDRESESTGTTKTSGDSINVLPKLSDAKAPISVTLNLDRSVRKIAGWVLAVIIASSVLIGFGIAAAIWMIFEYRDAQTEQRLTQYYIHDLDSKLYARGLLKEGEGFNPEKLKQELDSARK
jgi:hypothetical protein